MAICVVVFSYTHVDGRVGLGDWQRCQQLVAVAIDLDHCMKVDPGNCPDLLVNMPKITGASSVALTAVCRWLLLLWTGAYGVADQRVLTPLLLHGCMAAAEQ